MKEVTLVNVLDRNEKHPLKEGKNTIGRNAQGIVNDVNIPFKYGRISKRHALITLTDGQVTIEDTNSKNGIYINQNTQKTKSHVLKEGDKIKFSKNYTLEVQAEEEDEFKIRA